MYTFNFSTKQLSTIFDNVTHFVFHSAFSKFGKIFPREAYEIIDYKGHYAMALKAEYIEEFHLKRVYDTNESGTANVFGIYISWSLQEDGRYIFIR